MKSKSATIISVGDEILSGDVVDTNSTWLAKRLSTQGVDVEKIMAVGDDVDAIGEVIKSCHSDFIFVMGGLGPTHDDVTREGVAKGVSKELERNEVAERALREKYGIRGSLLKMADMPAGSEVIANPVGVAPGFRMENIIVLPGVPEEMMSMFDEIASLFRDDKGIRKEGWIMTDKSEHEILEVLNEAVKEFVDVKIGSYPYVDREGEGKSYKLRLKLLSADPDALKRAKRWLEERIKIC
ncbi:MAG: molybdopterin-binding protein [Methanophagales archaeon]|nr:molybdopterin-binding protein [Methanophagales archaeon]RLG33973.1 MAG: competence/damage-inducible protein A [Methanosarcinales archaeon]